MVKKKKEEELFFFFMQKTAYVMHRSLVGSEVCIEGSEKVAANAATVHTKIAEVARATESCICETIAPLIASAPAQP